ncbi:SagB/ThcOx family dehydrogenase [Streptomyces sp.]|uniref:SagB/ThcOx family dehydrogenase n=1 Tax=Streptomyces sp. TaxID=1931 RepID=UPI0028112D29|nr:SagB/ThcOx family dehydrogenase [Streptomyces sp.]
MDLVTALARARGAEAPGPDTPAGPPVPAWPGPGLALPPAGPGRLDLDRLLRLSLAAADATGRFRPAPSAGALHPVDAVLAVGEGCSLPPGRYGYDPLTHRAHPLTHRAHGPAPAPPGAPPPRAPRAGAPDPATAPHAGPLAVPPGVTVELTVTPRRTEAHYGHRAAPLLLLDTGHAAAALCLAALALGAVPPRPRLDGAAETPQATVHVPPPPGPVPADPAPPTPAELLARRSAPPPLTGTPDPDALRAVLATARAAGAGRLRWCVAVGGPEPALLESAPDGTLRRLAAGDARPALAVWAAGQRWLAGAGAVLLAHGCPSGADAPRIRRDHLHAGYAVGRAQLTAARHGLATRPVGSWQCADLGAALGGAPEQNWIVHGLALSLTPGSGRGSGAGPSGRPEKRTP